MSQQDSARTCACSAQRISGTMKAIGISTMKAVADYALGDAGEPCIVVGPCCCQRMRPRFLFQPPDPKPPIFSKSFADRPVLDPGRGNACRRHRKHRASILPDNKHEQIVRQHHPAMGVATPLQQASFLSGRGG